MLPFGTYPNEDGQGEHLGFAMPGMIQEPINALSRLFGTPSNPGTFGQGPDAPGNKEDMTTLLMSMYGGNAMNPAAAIPKGALASAALREAPQRMYHGTAAAEDFTHFRPSSEGSFGPGVYLSENPAIASQRALLDDGSRVFPVDAQGPFASVDDYLTALHANGRDPSAAQRVLADQGYTGVSGDLGSYGHPAPVTNVFQPGSIRSATTGETLYSDTGKPSLFGSAVAGAEANKPMRAYRGYGGRSEDEAFLYPERDMLFASSDPHTAATYANSAPNGDPVLSRYGISTQGAVAPLQMNFENPLRVDAQGSVWDQIPFNGKSWSTTDEIANLARERGHDGLILDNVRDGIGTAGNYLPPASTYVALKRGTVTSPLTGEMLFSDTGRPSLFGSAIAGAERNAPGFDVWHGSPHDFDKFELSKIGSGEGAQAFGHGLYFAENPNVAKGYQADLASAVNTPEMTAAKVLDYHGGDLDDALNYYGRLIDSAYADRNIDHARDLLRGKAALASPSTLPSPGGYLYQARIKADPGQFLDWETLSPEAQAQMKTQEGAAAYRDQGYHGIRYFDHGSRAGNEGTRNYVVFDDSIVNTIHKWRGDQQLYSDGLPSIWGNALAPSQDEPRNALLNY